ncbi:hypothetical protein DF053_26300 [Burkholderia cepacia]|nr:hypothetical protein WJ06_00560 [Burkholderia cepacia]KVW89180.1 hypothetical protein WL00_12055 [Burkholderia cepacia]KVX64720.1 hypothetical protein WL07_30130 [Burkholderia cepacia]KWC84931.1 hypothetical protein WL58_15185 [Burkholderia cepacia]RQT32927.1 hypothetical protein DF135_19705 [Burkholderia cepacia]
MPPLARIAPSVSDTVKMRVSSPERPDDSRFDTRFFPRCRDRVQAKRADDRPGITRPATKRAEPAS